MHYGFCSVALIPCRSEASEKAEMVNQLVFGESYVILEETEKWLKIETSADHYAGWIDKKLHTPLTESEFLSYRDTKKTVVAQALMGLHSANGRTLVSFGAQFPETSTDVFSIGPYRFSKEIIFSPPGHMIDLAYLFLNTPYLWGGKSLMGIDCSGFSQVVFRCFGKEIPRDAYQQAELGTTISLGDAKAGDLAFFGEPEKKITHVGICTGDGKIIHASGKCRIDVLDNKGILVEETGVYSHQLQLIKRI